MSNLDEQPAMPIALPQGELYQGLCPHDGFTKRERACIDLRIPESGDAELDALIRKARRQEMAAKAMQGALAFHGDGQSFATSISEAMECAELMLGRLERTT